MKLAKFDRPEEMQRASEIFMLLLGGEDVPTITDPEEWMDCGHHVSARRMRADNKRYCRECNRLQAQEKRIRNILDEAV